MKSMPCCTRLVAVMVSPDFGCLQTKKLLGIVGICYSHFFLNQCIEGIRLGWLMGFGGWASNSHIFFS